MTAFFAADSVGRAFHGRVVLKSASVWAEPGRVCALLGRNGCGKTTLLRIAAGLLVPDYGTVVFDGTVYERPRLHRLAARGLCYLPDSGWLSRRLTVRQHVDGMRWRFGADLDATALDTLSVQPLLDLRPDALSGGERRRVEVALACLRAPRCLLADEPFTEIAPADAEVIAGQLRRLADRGCAVIVTGHEVAQLLDLADDVVWMVAGTTHAIGGPAKAMAHEQFRREYLGVAAGVRAAPPASNLHISPGHFHG